MKSILTFFTALLLVPLTALPAAEKVELPRKPDFHLYLLIGQSNMAGRGTVEEQDRRAHPRVLVLNKEDQWSPAVDPLHFDKPSAGVGLGKTFGQVVADANPDVTIGLIPCAVGGSPIDAWRPGEYYAPTKSHPWDDALRRAKLALTSGELKGILWHQGESDAKAGQAEAYESKLHDLVARLRAEFAAPNVPFLAGQMGRFADQPWDDAHQRVNKAHRDLPRHVARTAFVSSEGLRHKGDKIHFDAASYRQLGERYAAVWLKLSAQTVQQSVRPNIVFIYADNLGYGDLGCYGNTDIKTPRIDQLAKEGSRCTDFYVVASTCTVSRGAVLTGRHPLRNGLTHQLGAEENWHGVGLPHRERIMPQYLKEAGYSTACFGKWNIGFAQGSRPTERGFDEFLGFRSGNINYFTHTYHGEYDMFQGIRPHRVEGYSGEIFANAASEYIKRQAKSGKPFFVYLPLNAPHYVSSINMKPGEKPQWQAPDSAFAAYGWSPEESDEKRRYLAVLTAMDENVGRVLDSLDATGLRDHTLVAFVSDMGPVLRPTHGLGVASTGIYRKGAPTLYEGGIRVPAIFRWPAKIPAGNVNREMLSHLDLLPAFLDVAGLPPPKDRVLDGRNCLPALSGKASSPHKRLVFQLGKEIAQREASLKIIRSKPDAPWELYDLSNDPSESNNLAAERPAEVARLAASLVQWQADVKQDASEPVVYRRSEAKP